MSEARDPEEVQRQLAELKQWVAGQPQLPNDLGDNLLTRFLHSCYYDLERAKTAINLFCTIRLNSPELLNNRDPESEKIQKTLKIVNLAQLKISGNRNLWIWQLNDPGLERYDYVQDARLFFLSTDAWLLNETHLEDADVVLMDVKDISLKFLAKFNVSVARKLSKYQEEAMPIRLKQIHLVNAPPFIDKIHALMKPFMKQAHIDMVDGHEIERLSTFSLHLKTDTGPGLNSSIHFHSPKSETLFNFIDKEELPDEYGGTGGKMADHMKRVLEVIHQKREFLIKDNLWKAIDLKKSGKESKNDVPETLPSFRSLAID
ncbi:hypothetical protein JYU34_015787 [Plutella xylostella]|uniref:CRAL-TRIO domain-containing protein n=1 Tax=Plutella xylostella TaxID=51655 RepID=A0ABQ7Q4Q9_PLUXY|nr:alpha-tocopherol transfer protein-like isoform X1 [Plutella xylostella]XP_048484557.1 alpha-tocopherol transfer protein-like isoform X1 [Plutella xylostella]XP_048484558.1 alpha-tocopherol transfer protein-like isoform X1 [Plutella xylostella]KAG7300224.1 hypothetical protein JYU34_015787 [Plutella xylostella]